MKYITSYTVMIFILKLISQIVIGLSTFYIPKIGYWFLFWWILGWAFYDWTFKKILEIKHDLDYDL